MDLHSFVADPDPAVFLNADPDPAVFFNADPDPAAFSMRIWIQPKKTLQQITSKRQKNTA